MVLTNHTRRLLHNNISSLNDGQNLKNVSQTVFNVKKSCVCTCLIYCEAGTGE